MRWRLICKVEEPARDASLLQDVEELDAAGDGQTVVQVAVDDEHGRGPVLDVQGRVPALVVLAVVPQRPVEVVLPSHLSASCSEPFRE